MKNLNFESGPQSSGSKESIDLMKIYQRVLEFLNKNLSNIEGVNLQVLGRLQIDDLKKLIEMSDTTHPPILHRLTSQEIEELKKYIREAESERGYTVNVSTLSNALNKLKDTLKKRIEGRKTKFDRAL